MSRQRYLTGLIGRNILKSRSPMLHEAEADAQCLRLVYSSFDFAVQARGEADLLRVLEALQLAGFAGVNITHPYKQSVIAHLDALSDDAKRIGAVNTVAFRNGQRIGYNTDVYGFAESFRRGLPGVEIANVVQVGAGGAGAATAHALLGLGVGRLTIHDVEQRRVDALSENLSRHFDSRRIVAGDDITQSVDTADGVVNATPMGMAEHPGTSVPSQLLRPDLWVADIVYFPLETQLLALAREAGCEVLNGSAMAVYQAAAAFEIFTGHVANVERMLQAFVADAEQASSG